MSVFEIPAWLQNLEKVVVVVFTNYLCTIPSPFSSWWNFFKIQKSPMEFLSTTVIRNPDYGKKLHKTSYRQTLLSITSIEKKRNVRLDIAVCHTCNLKQVRL